ncbi:hypothetical protein HK102_006535, partial [Quaeritorhiza haematococci]
MVSRTLMFVFAGAAVAAAVPTRRSLFQKRADNSDKYSYCDAVTPLKETYEKPADADLVLLQIMHRHGDRTPLNYIPFENTTWD